MLNRFKTVASLSDEKFKSPCGWWFEQTIQHSSRNAEADRKTRSDGYE